MKKILCLFLAAATFGAGCNQSVSPAPAADTSVSVPTATASADVTPTPTATIPDACTAVTSASIKQQLGLDVTTGVSSNSNLQGSTCTFKSADGTSAKVIVQFTAKGEMYYQPEDWFKQGVQLGVGDKGIFQGPDTGNTTAELMKSGSLAYVTIYAKGAYTASQVKAFMKSIADQL